MKSNLEKGDDVLLSGFGKFKVRDKRTRKGRNPGTSKGWVPEGATPDPLKSRMTLERCRLDALLSQSTQRAQRLFWPQMNANKRKFFYSGRE